MGRYSEQLVPLATAVKQQQTVIDWLAEQWPKAIICNHASRSRRELFNHHHTWKIRLS